MLERAVRRTAECVRVYVRGRKKKQPGRGTEKNRVREKQEYYEEEFLWLTEEEEEEEEGKDGKEGK